MVPHPDFRHKWLALALLGCLVPALSGCFTKKLWGEQAEKNFSEPATNMRLELFEAKSDSDVLVKYEALSETKGETRLCAFLLFANAKNLKEGHKPRFIRPERRQGLPSIPVFIGPSEAMTNLPSYCLLSTNGQQFTLHFHGKPAQTYELPVFEENRSVVRRIVLTPIALLADAGTVITFGAVWWLYCGAPGLQ